jgi:plasmid stabilization system protein ParE
MSLPVVFRRVARAEMDEAIAWYEYQGAGLGLQFTSEIDTYLQRIADSPKHFPKTRGEIRRAVLHRFPYTIHFLAETNRIVVLAVFHVKRNPTVLEGRL